MKQKRQNMKKCLLRLQIKSKLLCDYALHWLSVQGKIYYKGIPQLLLVGVLLFPIAYFTDKYIEACFQIIALFSLRYKFPKTFHAKTTMQCTFITLSIGYIAIPSTAFLSTTLFSSICISFIIAYISWFVQEFIDRKKPNVQWYMLDGDDLRQYCNEHALTQRQTEVVCAIKKGIVGEKQIDYMLDKGFDYSGSTQDREYKEIKKKLGVDTLKIK